MKTLSSILVKSVLADYFCAKFLKHTEEKKMFFIEKNLSNKVTQNHARKKYISNEPVYKQYNKKIPFK